MAAGLAALAAAVGALARSAVVRWLSVAIAAGSVGFAGKEAKSLLSGRTAWLVGGVLALLAFGPGFLSGVGRPRAHSSWNPGR